MALEKILTFYKNRTNTYLKTFLAQQDIRSKTLSEAIHYSVLNNGKRLRPLLVYLTGTALGAAPEALDPAAGAIELVHCYSLIHDDLPAMDNATRRRGEPTCHIKYDEATAILAGDALQALAFELLASNTIYTAEQRVHMIAVLAQASGAAGMVDGQALESSLPKNPSTEALELLYQRKTGNLIVASIQLGYLAANLNSTSQKKSLDQFAYDIGLAFQIHDDLLDIEGDTALTGKDTGLDQQNEKNTYPAVFGIDFSKEKMKQLMASALTHLAEVKQPTDELKALAQYIVSRRS